MEILRRTELSEHALPGRVIQKAVGKDSASESAKMTMGFATYSQESGPMEPHHHAEEIVYILSAKDGWVRYGDSKEALPEKVALEPGTTLHIPSLLWHVFEFGEGGHVDIIFFYGQVDNIRPEEGNS